ncbi:MAG TPA: ABC transporter ATP-binding protein [Rhodothermales bacterium]|nr:ABC transporter ATP-binding protein [Rhodothermales bacterium]
MTHLIRVFPYLRPYWKLAVLSIVFTILVAFVGLLAPWPLKIVIDHVLESQPLPDFLAPLLGWAPDGSIKLLIFAVVAGLLITFFQHGISVAISYINTRIEQGMVLDVRSALFQHTQRLSLAFHDRRRTGKLIFAINNQGGSAAGLIMALQPLAQSLLTLIGMFWIAYKIDAKLTLLALSVVPFLYYSVGYYANHIVPQLQRVKGLEIDSLSIVHEAFTMLRVIVAFGREDHEHSRFRKQGQKAVDARVKLTVKQTLFSLGVNMATAAGTALVLGYGAYRAMQGLVTPGELLVFLAYIAAIYKPLESIFYTFNSIQEHAVHLESIFKLLDRHPEIKDASDAVPVTQCKGQITFENVNFSYAKRKHTLRRISFDAQPGQKIGIVGQTGAGKTTLISLIPRFYDVHRGRILLDGVDISTLKLKSLREQISIVLQEPLLFAGSIADNIRYGRLDATMDEIIEAAKAANAHDFIMSLPKQYDTVLGETGSQVSGGERQRISVARAFLKDAPILILDEPTSSIDSKTESVILDALDRLMIGRTTFMIAHRLSTLRNPDLLLVLKDGIIMEQGTHAALIERNGVYKELCEAQSMQAEKQVKGALGELEKTRRPYAPST